MITLAAHRNDHVVQLDEGLVACFTDRRHFDVELTRSPWPVTFDEKNAASVVYDSVYTSNAVKTRPCSTPQDLTDEVSRLTAQLGTTLDQGHSVSLLIRIQKAESLEVPLASS